MVQKSCSSSYIGFVVPVVSVNPEIPLIQIFPVIQVVLAIRSSCYNGSGVPMVLVFVQYIVDHRKVVHHGMQRF